MARALGTGQATAAVFDDSAQTVLAWNTSRERRAGLQADLRVRSCSCPSS
jgi:hypothetical protein